MLRTEWQGFRVQALEFRVWGLGFGFWGFESRVSGYRLHEAIVHPAEKDEELAAVRTRPRVGHGQQASFSVPRGREPSSSCAYNSFTDVHVSLIQVATAARGREPSSSCAYDSFTDVHVSLIQKLPRRRRTRRRRSGRLVVLVGRQS